MNPVCKHKIHYHSLMDKRTGVQTVGTGIRVRTPGAVLHVHEGTHTHAPTHMHTLFQVLRPIIKLHFPFYPLF